MTIATRALGSVGEVCGSGASGEGATEPALSPDRTLGALGTLGAMAASGAGGVCPEVAARGAGGVRRALDSARTGASNGLAGAAESGGGVLQAVNRCTMRSPK
jgi:hypothetical protein